MSKNLNVLLAICALLAMLAIACVALASGTTAQVSWTLPTAYSDGSTLAATDIASVTVSWAPVTGQAGPSGSQTIPGAATSASITVPCGSTSFEVLVTTTSAAVYPSVSSSDTSPVPYATGIKCVPNAPTGLTAK